MEICSSSRIERCSLYIRKLYSIVYAVRVSSHCMWTARQSKTMCPSHHSSPSFNKAVMFFININAISWRPTNEDMLTSCFSLHCPFLPSPLPLSFLSSWFVFLYRTPQNGARMRGKRPAEKHELEVCWAPLLPVCMGPYLSAALPPGASWDRPTCLQGIWLAYFRQGAFPPLQELPILCGKTPSRIYNQI